RSRNVFRQPEKRNVPPTGLCHTGPGTHGSGRIHRSILQSPTTPFQPRLPHPSPSLDRPPRPHRNGINHSGLTRKKTRATCPKTLTQPMTALTTIDGVHDVHHVHAWTITSGQIVFSAHLHVPDPHQDAGRVLRTAAQLLRDQFGVYFSTLQIEDECQAQEPAALDITDQTRPNSTNSGS